MTNYSLLFIFFIQTQILKEKKKSDNEKEQKKREKWSDNAEKYHDKDGLLTMGKEVYFL